MNEAVRKAARDRMKSGGLTQEALANLTGLKRPNLTRMLTGRSGSIPENWLKVLDVLGLELIAVPKTGKP